MQIYVGNVQVTDCWQELSPSDNTHPKWTASAKLTVVLFKIFLPFTCLITDCVTNLSFIDRALYSDHYQCSTYLGDTLYVYFAFCFYVVSISTKPNDPVDNGGLVVTSADHSKVCLSSIFLIQVIFSAFAVYNTGNMAK